MSASPKVSIGLPVYNGERYLAEALESVLAQTFEDFELVICDNASVDGTRDICERFAARDKRIRYFRNRINIGGFHNHNRVFAMACGQYFGWASDDDVRAARHIERCVEGLDSDPAIALSFTRSGRIDENGQPLTTTEPDMPVESPDPRTRFRHLIRRDYSLEPIYGLIRADILRQTPLEPPYADSDRVLLANLGLRGPFLKIDEELFFRREHPMRSVNVFPSRADRTAWFDPAHAGRIVLPFHREFFEYLRTVAGSPVGWACKALCAVDVLNWAYQNRRALLNDYRVVAHRIVEPMRRRSRTT